MSSSRPGASPTNITRAFRIAVGEHQSRRGVLQRAAVEVLAAASRNASSVGAVRAASRAEAIAASGAGAASLRGTGRGRGERHRRRRWWRALRAAGGRNWASGSASRLTGSSPSAQSTPASR